MAGILKTHELLKVTQNQRIEAALHLGSKDEQGHGHALIVAVNN